MADKERAIPSAHVTLFKAERIQAASQTKSNFKQEFTFSSISQSGDKQNLVNGDEWSVAKRQRVVEKRHPKFKYLKCQSAPAETLLM
jgi:hypothetical protein